MSKVFFIDVYETPQRTVTAIDVLWKLLTEREPHMNISHKGLPPLADHVHFVERRPYQFWWMLTDGQEYIGSLYVTKQSEIGLFIFKAFQGQGFGTAAIEELRKRYPTGTFLANIAPENTKSHQFFQRMGFTPLQVTYALNMA